MIANAKPPRRRDARRRSRSRAAGRTETSSRERRSLQRSRGRAASSSRGRRSTTERPFGISRSSAWSKSSFKSSMCSSPTETRRRFSGARVPGPSTDARCSMRLSVPPRLVACVKSASRLAMRDRLCRDRAQPAPRACRRTPLIWRARDGVRRMRLQSGIVNALRPSGASRETRRARARCALCACTRSGSVRMPRIVSQHSNGDGTAPPLI